MQKKLNVSHKPKKSKNIAQILPNQEATKPNSNDHLTVTVGNDCSLSRQQIFFIIDKQKCLDPLAVVVVMAVLVYYLRERCALEVKEKKQQGSGSCYRTVV